MEHSSFAAGTATTVVIPESEPLQPELAELAIAAALPNETVSEPRSDSRQAAMRVFLSTFATIFLAELGDKTQVTTLLMSAESHQPWTVFVGAGIALVSTSLIGVWIGCWLAKRISPKTLEVAAGLLLLLVSAQLVWEVAHI